MGNWGLKTPQTALSIPIFTNKLTYFQSKVKENRVFFAPNGDQNEKKMHLNPHCNGLIGRLFPYKLREWGLNTPKKRISIPNFNKKAPETPNERPYKTFLRCLCNCNVSHKRHGASGRKKDYPGRETQVVPCVLWGCARNTHTLCVCVILLSRSSSEAS